MFNEQQIKNLITFLSRVDLKGSEVPAFNEILFSIEKSIQEKESEELANAPKLKKENVSQK